MSRKNKPDANHPFAALQRVNQRYARPLVLAPNELTSAIEQARLDVELSLPPPSA